MLQKRRSRFLVRIIVFAVAFGLIGVSGAAAGSGWFAGASIGQTKWKNYDEELASFATSIDDSDTGWFAFGALYGFLACFLMVVFAKVLGRFVKRAEDYYGVDEDD